VLLIIVHALIAISENDYFFKGMTSFCLDMEWLIPISPKFPESWTMNEFFPGCHFLLPIVDEMHGNDNL